MEDLYDPEEKILCPYNNSHHIRRCRMSFHLVKCKQNYGEQKMIPCDFNATHVIPEPELQYHHQVCPDRKKIEARIVDSRVKTENKYPIPKIDVATEENWDDNCYPSYDPKKYAESSDVIRQLDVASGAKRKNFRMGERQRLSQLNADKANSSTRQKPEVVQVQMPPTRREDVVSDRQTISERFKMGQQKVFKLPTRHN